jgi:hypothetical protein
MQPDPSNPACVLLSSHYKFFYIDCRVGKAVKRFGEGASTIRLPANPGGQFIASDSYQNHPTQVWDLGTMKVVHKLQTRKERNFVTSALYANVAVTFGPTHSDEGGAWGVSFFDLASGKASCVHELNASVYPKKQLDMTAHVVVGLDEMGKFVSLKRP